jgi:hypothetical protein
MGQLPPTKLHTNLKGPLKVITFTGAEYKLLNLVSNEIETHHVKYLHPFHYDPVQIDPTTIALKDRDESVIKSILSHTGHKAKKKEMEFLVEWEDNSPNLWLPWKELRNNSKLHQYLIRNRMKSIIPISYR